LNFETRKNNMSEAGGAIGNVIHNKTLTGMAMAYSRSRILCAAARLGLADALGSSEHTVDELARRCQADTASLYRLLRALASFGVVTETSPARFVLTPFGEPLRRDVPNSEWAAVVFWGDLLADDWSYMTECIRTGENAAAIAKREGLALRWSKVSDGGEIFRAVMGTAPAEDYMSIARAWDFSAHHVVADLGGGGGALISAVLKAFPSVQGMLVDHQESIDRAKPRFEAEMLNTRCKLLPADLCVAIPAGADVHMLKHVLHGYVDSAAISVLQNCKKVLPANGRLLVIEFVLPDVVDHADLDLEKRLMSDLNMLAVTGGKERGAIEWKALLKNSGFECVNIIPVPGDLTSIIEAAPRR
jgi:hypothetical protein